MYYLYYFIYVILSTVLGLWVFCWALRNGQFRDQQRARFLPLQQLAENPGVKADTPHGKQARGILCLLISAILSGAAFGVYLYIGGG
ncbi:MAG: cbb3-type cytochrome oxidase assembly protein CcoS [Deltaproteobacteria bacterium]|nr:cbb3-type cytochrome oxidase assembly protein CcoS [Deltaproteobacteria bacterium]MBW1962989.1 cbb3-type cytochrome oxidase assembly protein CcoS [Deltaproteobacteria bacterium]MBW1993188.1 cbb3-type cytochrome oxidase assembly protein CcoS [Deltaproteobacteria bacterium]MBW2151810.1 cbb3-type cytochrome oxidase assembly protein CcoS [Deltaproteobacteria bacterium]